MRALCNNKWQAAETNQLIKQTWFYHLRWFAGVGDPVESFSHNV